MEDLKKINGKENDIVKRGGEVSEKNQILNVLLKVTFYWGGVDQNQCHFFKMFINSSFYNFSAHPVTSRVKFLI